MEVLNIIWNTYSLKLLCFNHLTSHTRLHHSEGILWWQLLNQCL